MRRYIRKKILISFLLLTSAAYAGDISVCLWRGNNPDSVSNAYRNKYPGKIRVVPHNGQFLIINTLDIEDYLAGVLAKEMDSMWPAEALKAQAVVSRTFALYTAGENKVKNLPYDIENSVFHQVYGATGCEKIIEAVKETEGEILTYQGKAAQVFFHASCGGGTSKTSDVWGGTRDHIEAVSCIYCAESPYCSWKKTFTSGQLSRLFRQAAPVDRIEVGKTDNSGRVTLLKIFSKDGKIYSLTGHKFRMEVNNGAPRALFNCPDILPSTRFRILQSGNKVVFEGEGYGHGVGMCQWGTRIMAGKGYNYIQILQYYFPAMEITVME